MGCVRGIDSVFKPQEVDGTLIDHVVATILCCHVLLPCYVVVLGLSFCSVVLS